MIKSESHVILAYSICSVICSGTHSNKMTADLKMIHSASVHLNGAAGHAHFVFIDTGIQVSFH